MLLLASGLENLTNDLPLQPGFVPFVDRSARYLSGEDRLGGARVVDSFVQLRTAAGDAERVGSRCRGGGSGWEAAAVAGRSGDGAVVSAYEDRVLPDAVCEWEGCSAGRESGPAGVGPGGDAGRCSAAVEREHRRAAGGRRVGGND